MGMGGNGNVGSHSRTSLIEGLQRNEREAMCTFDVQVDDLAADRERVDRAAISAGVVGVDVSHLQVPLVAVRPDHRESHVVDDAAVAVRQRHRVHVQPCNLTATRAQHGSRNIGNPPTGGPKLTDRL